MRSILIFLTFCVCTCASPDDQQMVMTVLGPIPADSLGLTLIHEHVFLDWRGADSIQPAEWDEEAIFQAVLPYLKEVRAMGVETMLECTPAFLGRNPRLLRRLSAASGLQLLTNTGYYGAVNDKYLPKWAFSESSDSLAGRWVEEFRAGIEGTEIKPGFIKIAVDSDSVLSEVDEKLVRAAARAHLRTGLTIVSHTGPDQPALRQAAVIRAEGLDLSAWVWTHAQGGSAEIRDSLARKGAWISLDGLGWMEPNEGDSSRLFAYVDALNALRKEDLLHRVLISHDAGWYTFGQPGGGDYRPHTLLFTLLLPILRREGWTEKQIHQLLVENPREAYAIRVRALGVDQD